MATFKSDKNREWDIIQTFPDLVNLLWSMENYRHGGKKERIEKPKKKKKSRILGSISMFVSDITTMVKVS